MRQITIHFTVNITPSSAAALSHLCLYSRLFSPPGAVHLPLLEYTSVAAHLSSPHMDNEANTLNNSPKQKV